MSLLFFGVYFILQTLYYSAIYKCVGRIGSESVRLVLLYIPPLFIVILYQHLLSGAKIISMNPTINLFVLFVSGVMFWLRYKNVRNLVADIELLVVYKGEIFPAYVYIKNIILLVVGVVLEEVIFRLILIELTRGYGVLICTFVSTSFFVLSHYLHPNAKDKFNRDDYLWQVIVSILCGFIYYYTSNILLCVVIHLSMNMVNILIQYNLYRYVVNEQ